MGLRYVKTSDSKVRRTYYPDLRARIHLSTESPVMFFLELDIGTKGPGYWKKKIWSRELL